MPVDPAHLRQRMSEVLEAMSELRRLTLKPYSTLSREEKYSIRYHVIVLAEAVGSVCIHVATEDFSREPQSYSECFRMMEEESIFDCAKDLTEMMRLRNLLVHRYWVIDDAQVYGSIKNDFGCVDKFLRSIEGKYEISL